MKPVVENEWENGERTGFFSFSRFQTPHGQCNRYNIGVIGVACGGDLLYPGYLLND